MKKCTSFLRLLAFEWKKNFLSPWMVLFLIVLLALNGWKIHGEYQHKVEEFTPYQAIYEDFYERWKGSITTENVRELMSIYGPLKEKEDAMRLDFTEGSGTYTSSEFGDYRFFFSQFANEMEYDYLYVNHGIAVTQEAMAMAEFYESVGNPYKAAESQAFAQTFQKRVVSAFCHFGCHAVCHSPQQHQLAAKG